MNSNVKTAVLWIVLICVAVLIWVVVKTGKGGVESQPDLHRVYESGGAGQS